MDTFRHSSLRSKNYVSQPIIGDIMVYIDELFNSNYYKIIDKELNNVIKYYRNDMYEVVSFFLDNWQFNLNSFKHQYLLRRLFKNSGLENHAVLQFLNRITDIKIVQKLGIERYVRDGKTCYDVHI